MSRQTRLRKRSKRTRWYICATGSLERLFWEERMQWRRPLGRELLPFWRGGVGWCWRWGLGASPFCLRGKRECR